METKRLPVAAKPDWLKTAIPGGEIFTAIKKDLRHRELFTVCEEARCPNISECWSTRTATFMVCGDTCTRACRFCNVKTGNPQGMLNPHEPEQVADSVHRMGLKYVVITMVDRDDLPDLGVGHVLAVMEAVRKQNPTINIELLAGDFQGRVDCLTQLCTAGLQVLAHNLETTRPLTPRVRDARASYAQSLKVLQAFRELSPRHTLVKSSLMLGLGETRDQVCETMSDLRTAGVDILTFGQYMRPSKKHLSVKEWVIPSIFQEYQSLGEELGFKAVVANPLARSSYKAQTVFENVMGLSL